MKKEGLFGGFSLEQLREEIVGSRKIVIVQQNRKTFCFSAFLNIATTDNLAEEKSPTTETINFVFSHGKTLLP